METFSAILALFAANSPVTDEFLAQRPVTRSFDVFFDLRLNKQLNKHSWGWWFETLSHSLWRHCNVPHISVVTINRHHWSQLLSSFGLLRVYFSYICHNFSNIFEMEIPVKVIYKNSTGKPPRLSGTLYIERSGPEDAPGVTEVTPEDYDSTGAVKYMIAVLVVYSLSAFLLMASRTRRQRERLALYREVQHFFKKKPTYARQSRMEEVQKCRASLVDTEGVFVGDISSGGLPLHYVAKRKHINPICNYLCGLVADEKRTSQHIMVDEVAGVHGPSSSSRYYQSPSVVVDDMAEETPEVYDSIDRNDRKKCHCKCKQEEYNMEKMQARRALTPSLCGAQNDRGEVWQLQWYKKVHKLPNLNKTNLQEYFLHHIIYIYICIYIYIYIYVDKLCLQMPPASTPLIAFCLAFIQVPLASNCWGVPLDQLRFSKLSKKSCAI